MVFAGNPGGGFHTHRGDGAILWPQRLYLVRRFVKSKTAAGLMRVPVLVLCQVPQIPVDTGVKLPPHYNEGVVKARSGIEIEIPIPISTYPGSPTVGWG